MLCKKCGSELEENALFCRFCGNRKEEAESVSVAGSVVEEAVEDGILFDDDDDTQVLDLEDI